MSEAKDVELLPESVVVVKCEHRSARLWPMDCPEPHPNGIQSQVYYRTPTPSPSTEERAREIIKHISDAALELVFVRHDITSDEFDASDYPDMPSAVTAKEAWWEGDIKPDILNCLTGDDSGCLDPKDLDETNCELLWLQSVLAAFAATPTR